MNKFLHWGLTVIQGSTIFLVGIGLLYFFDGSYILPGFAFLFTGMVGIAEFQLIRKFDRSYGDFLWSIATTITGTLLIIRIGVDPETQKLEILFFIIFSGVWMLWRGWSLQWISHLSWGILFMGIIISFSGLLIAINWPKEYSGLTISLTILIMGASIITLGIVKKKVFEVW